MINCALQQYVEQKKLNDKQELRHVLCIISKSLTKNKKPY